MTLFALNTISDHVRGVTDEEVSHYREHGWVSLPGLVSGDLAGELLAHLKQATGIDYDELRREHPDAEAVLHRIRSEGFAKIFYMSRLHDEMVWDIVTSRSLGEAAAELTGQRPMRIFTDGVICKLPAWSEQENLKAVGAGSMSGKTVWHQDFPPVPWDRAGGVQFWMALCEITPEMGAMQHLSGSHREPPLGCVQYTGGEQTMEQLHPELFEKYELSPAHHFQPGDVLAHDPLTLHYAQENQTDKLRWVYTSYRIPADTLYNGIPNARFDEFGFTPWKPFDHPKFPIVTSDQPDGEPAGGA
jgi:ectoine hydroxylase-related dioxygenase (phytanoyl-CoA dioxygenase family)